MAPQRTVQLFIILFALFFATFTHAESPQTVPDAPSFETLMQRSSQASNALVQLLTLTATPSSPSPGQTIEIKAKTPTFDPDTAQFSWVLNGVPMPSVSGQGHNTISATAGSLGSTIRASVQVLSPRGQTLSQSITIYVSDVSVVVTAKNSYVPKWYKGKALPYLNAPIRITAIPGFIIGGVALDPKDLIYTWSANGQKIAGEIGAQFAELNTQVFPKDSLTIKVVIEDTRKRILKEKQLNIIVYPPEATIYQTFPLGGIEFRKSLSFLQLTPGRSIDMQIEPFFFNTASHKTLTYSWKVAGENVKGAVENPHIITVSTPEIVTRDIIVVSSISTADYYSPFVSKVLIIPKQQ